MTDTFDVVLNRSEIAVIHTALGVRLAQLLKEWEHQERAGAVDAAATLFEKADDVRTLMNKVGMAPLKLRQ
jgi:hypothetical protein